VLGVASWPYVALGLGYAALAVGLLIMGAQRQLQLQRAVHQDVPAPLSFRVVAVFTFGGVVLVFTTMILVVAQT
jgi:putative membrane protein